MLSVLRADGSRRSTYMHILVAEAFYGPKPAPKMVVRHLDDDGLNNRVDNLRWGTYRENSADMELHQYHRARREAERQRWALQAVFE